jgi:flavin reductase (DIM6/NTAB) family NADH-FMN oxidoreductase RutF
MLITAGTTASFNTMTASWGGFGHLWNRDICWCVIRPQRHTYGFTERSSRFTLSFFDREYREALRYCGTHSGRDVDKMAATGLTPVQTVEGSIYFEEARLVIECQKIYLHDIDPAHFLDPDIHNEYPDKDYHRLYLGRIVRCLQR